VIFGKKLEGNLEKQEYVLQFILGMRHIEHQLPAYEGDTTKEFT
jgi:hypothetical protein